LERLSPVPLYQERVHRCVRFLHGHRYWTAGIPGTSGQVKVSGLGTRKIAGGLSQVTYNRQALYLDGDETPNLSSGHMVLGGEWQMTRRKPEDLSPGNSLEES